MCAKQVKKLKKGSKSKTKKSDSKKSATKKSSEKKAAAKKAEDKKAVKKAKSKKTEKKSVKKSSEKKAPATKKASASKTKTKSDSKKNAAEKTAPEKTKVKTKIPKKGTATKKTFAGRATIDEAVLLTAVEAAQAKPPAPKRKKPKKPSGPTHKDNSGARKPIAIVKDSTPKKNTKKTRYNQKELQFFKKIIDTKLEEAISQLEFYQSQIKSIGTNPDNKLKGLGDGTSTSETEKLYSLAARQRKHIQHLENAKLRIKNNIYGVCRVTGILISKERLIAVPHATLSIQAKLKS